MLAGHLSTEEIAQHTDKLAVLPFGAFEQHGPWLPLLTDSIIAEEIAKRIEERLSDKALLFPTLWFGDSLEHRGFSGTLSVKARTLIDVLDELFSWLDQSGLRRGILLNAHGGNVSLAATACEEFSRGHSFKVRSVSVYPQAVTRRAQELFGVKETHGGSTEISILYALRPDLKKTAASSVPNPFPYPGGGRLALYETRELSQNGVLHSTESIEIDTDKGEQLVRAMVESATLTARNMLLMEVP